MRFDSNISTLEERVDLTTMTMDEFHGTLTTYEMRMDQDNLVTMEAAFKESKKTNQKNNKKAKSDSSSSDVSKDDDEVDNFVKTLKRGTGKYKGKLPLIYFNCDDIVHFSNKFTYNRKKINEEDDPKRKQIQKVRRNKKKIFKKILCTKEDSSSLDEDEVNDSDT